MAQARTIVVGEGPEPWARLGFAVQEDGSARVGGLLIATGGTALGIEAAGLAGERPDGLRITGSAAGPVTAGTHPNGALAVDHVVTVTDDLDHPNGALAVDHVVAVTDDLDRTVAALERAGAPLRRRAEPRPGRPMAFHRLGGLVLEVVQTGARPSALWGLVVIAPQPGRDPPVAG